MLKRGRCCAPLPPLEETLLVIHPLFYTVVGYNLTVYAVTEGVDASVTLTIVRSGNLDLPANVTFMTVPGSAGGMCLQ